MDNEMNLKSAYDSLKRKEFEQQKTIKQMSERIKELEAIVSNTDLLHDVSGSKQMIEALDELVQVKEYKEKHGKDEQYETAKKQAWKNAKDLLNTYYR